MKLIQCIAIDDEPLAIEVIKSHVAQIPDLDLVATFQNPIAAYETLREGTIDLIFLDIEMPLLSGIDFLKSLQKAPKVIFVTAYRHYAIESYELDVVDYLLKPISFTRFFKAITKYKSISHHPPTAAKAMEILAVNDHMYVNANKKFIKILFDEILYVESIKDYVRVYMKDKNVMTKDSISNFEQKLPQQFLRVHRSYIVNMQKVTAFTKADVEIDVLEIPIGASYKEQVIAMLENGS